MRCSGCYNAQIIPDKVGSQFEHQGGFAATSRKGHTFFFMYFEKALVRDSTIKFLTEHVLSSLRNILSFSLTEGR